MQHNDNLKTRKGFGCHYKHAHSKHGSLGADATRVFCAYTKTFGYIK
jgi:hypothetical protein